MDQSPPRVLPRPAGVGQAGVIGGMQQTPGKGFNGNPLPGTIKLAESRGHASGPLPLPTVIGHTPRALKHPPGMASPGNRPPLGPNLTSANHQGQHHFFSAGGTVTSHSGLSSLGLLQQEGLDSMTASLLLAQQQQLQLQQNGYPHSSSSSSFAASSASASASHRPSAFSNEPLDGTAILRSAAEKPPPPESVFARLSKPKPVPLGNLVVPTRKQAAFMSSPYWKGMDAPTLLPDGTIAPASAASMGDPLAIFARLAGLDPEVITGLGGDAENVAEGLLNKATDPSGDGYSDPTAQQLLAIVAKAKKDLFRTPKGRYGDDDGDDGGVGGLTSQFLAEYRRLRKLIPAAIQVQNWWRSLPMRRLQRMTHNRCHRHRVRIFTAWRQLFIAQKHHRDNVKRRVLERLADSADTTRDIRGVLMRLGEKLIYALGSAGDGTMFLCVHLVMSPRCTELPKVLFANRERHRQAKEQARRRRREAREKNHRPLALTDAAPPPLPLPPRGSSPPPFVAHQQQQQAPAETVLPAGEPPVLFFTQNDDSDDAPAPGSASASASAAAASSSSSSSSAPSSPASSSASFSGSSSSSSGNPMPSSRSAASGAGTSRSRVRFADEEGDDEGSGNKEKGQGQDGIQPPSGFPGLAIEALPPPTAEEGARGPASSSSSGDEGEEGEEEEEGGDEDKDEHEEEEDDGNDSDESEDSRRERLIREGNKPLAGPIGDGSSGATGGATPLVQLKKPAPRLIPGLACLPFAVRFSLRERIMMTINPDDLDSKGLTWDEGEGNNNNNGGSASGSNASKPALPNGAPAASSTISAAGGAGSSTVMTNSGGVAVVTSKTSAGGLLRRARKDQLDNSGALNTPSAKRGPSLRLDLHQAAASNANANANASSGSNAAGNGAGAPAPGADAAGAGPGATTTTTDYSSIVGAITVPIVIHSTGGSFTFRAPEGLEPTPSASASASAAIDQLSSAATATARTNAGGAGGSSTQRTDQMYPSSSGQPQHQNPHAQRSKSLGSLGSGRRSKAGAGSGVSTWDKDFNDENEILSLARARHTSFLQKASLPDIDLNPQTYHLHALALMRSDKAIREVEEQHDATVRSRTRALLELSINEPSASAGTPTATATATGTAATPTGDTATPTATATAGTASGGTLTLKPSLLLASVEGSVVVDGDAAAGAKSGQHKKPMAWGNATKSRHDYLRQVAAICKGLVSEVKDLQQVLHMETEAVNNPEATAAMTAAAVAAAAAELDAGGGAAAGAAGAPSNPVLAGSLRILTAAKGLPGTSRANTFNSAGIALASSVSNNNSSNDNPKEGIEAAVGRVAAPSARVLATFIHRTGGGGMFGPSLNEVQTIKANASGLGVGMPTSSSTKSMSYEEDKQNKSKGQQFTKDPFVALIRSVEFYIKRSWFNALRNAANDKKNRIMLARSKLQSLARFFLGGDSSWAQEKHSTYLRMWHRYCVYRKAVKAGKPAPTFDLDRRPLPQWDDFISREIIRARRRMLAERMEYLRRMGRMFRQWCAYVRWCYKRARVLGMVNKSWQRRVVRYSLYQWRAYPLLIKLRMRAARKAFLGWASWTKKADRVRASAYAVSAKVSLRLLNTCWDALSLSYDDSRRMTAFQVARVQGGLMRAQGPLLLQDAPAAPTAPRPESASRLHLSAVPSSALANVGNAGGKQTSQATALEVILSLRASEDPVSGALSSLIYAWKQWKGYTQRRRCWLRVCTAYRRYARGHLLGTVFRAWRDTHRHSKQIRSTAGGGNTPSANSNNDQMVTFEDANANADAASPTAAGSKRKTYAPLDLYPQVTSEWIKKAAAALSTSANSRRQQRKSGLLLTNGQPQRQLQLQPGQPFNEIVVAEQEDERAFITTLLRGNQEDEPPTTMTKPSASISANVHRRLVIERQRALRKRLANRRTTPLHTAADEGDLVTLRKLLTAPPPPPPAHASNTPNPAPSNMPVAVSWLEVQDVDGSTPLHLACRHFSSAFIPVAVLLLQAGAKPLLKDDSGRTCVDRCTNVALRAILTAHVARLESGKLTSNEKRALNLWRLCRYSGVSLRWLFVPFTQTFVEKRLIQRAATQAYQRADEEVVKATLKLELINRRKLQRMHEEEAAIAAAKAAKAAGLALPTNVLTNAVDPKKAQTGGLVMGGSFFGDFLNKEKGSGVGIPDASGSLILGGGAAALSPSGALSPKLGGMAAGANNMVEEALRLQNAGLTDLDDIGALTTIDENGDGSGTYRARGRTLSTLTSLLRSADADGEAAGRPQLTPAQELRLLEEEEREATALLARSRMADRKSELNRFLQRVSAEQTAEFDLLWSRQQKDLARRRFVMSFLVDQADLLLANAKIRAGLAGMADDNAKAAFVASIVMGTGKVKKAGDDSDSDDDNDAGKRKTGVGASASASAANAAGGQSGAGQHSQQQGGGAGSGGGGPDGKGPGKRRLSFSDMTALLDADRTHRDAQAIALQRAMAKGEDALKAVLELFQGEAMTDTAKAAAIRFQEETEKQRKQQLANSLALADDPAIGITDSSSAAFSPAASAALALSASSAATAAQCQSLKPGQAVLAATAVKPGTPPTSGTGTGTGTGTAARRPSAGGARSIGQGPTATASSTSTPPRPLSSSSRQVSSASRPSLPSNKPATDAPAPAPAAAAATTSTINASGSVLLDSGGSIMTLPSEAFVAVGPDGNPLPATTTTAGGGATSSTSIVGSAATGSLVSGEGSSVVTASASLTRAGTTRRRLNPRERAETKRRLLEKQQQEARAARNALMAALELSSRAAAKKKHKQHREDDGWQRQGEESSDFVHVLRGGLVPRVAVALAADATTATGRSDLDPLLLGPDDANAAAFAASSAGAGGGGALVTVGPNGELAARSPAVHLAAGYLPLGQQWIAASSSSQELVTREEVARDRAAAGRVIGLADFSGSSALASRRLAVSAPATPADLSDDEGDDNDGAGNDLSAGKALYASNGEAAEAEKDGEGGAVGLKPSPRQAKRRRPDSGVTIGRGEIAPRFLIANSSLVSGARTAGLLLSYTNGGTSASSSAASASAALAARDAAVSAAASIVAAKRLHQQQQQQLATQGDAGSLAPFPLNGMRQQQAIQQSIAAGSGTVVSGGGSRLGASSGARLRSVLTFADRVARLRQWVSHQQRKKAAKNKRLLQLAKSGIKGATAADPFGLMGGLSASAGLGGAAAEEDEKARGGGAALLTVPFGTDYDEELGAAPSPPPGSAAGSRPATSNGGVRGAEGEGEVGGEGEHEEEDMVPEWFLPVEAIINVDGTAVLGVMQSLPEDWKQKARNIPRPATAVGDNSASRAQPLLSKTGLLRCVYGTKDLVARAEKKIAAALRFQGAEAFRTRRGSVDAVAERLMLHHLRNAAGVSTIDDDELSLLFRRRAHTASAQAAIWRNNNFKQDEGGAGQTTALNVLPRLRGWDLVRARLGFGYHETSGIAQKRKAEALARMDAAMAEQALAHAQQEPSLSLMGGLSLLDPSASGSAVLFGGESSVLGAGASQANVAATPTAGALGGFGAGPGASGSVPSSLVVGAGGGSGSLDTNFGSAVTTIGTAGGGSAAGGASSLNTDSTLGPLAPADAGPGATGAGTGGATDVGRGARPSMMHAQSNQAATAAATASASSSDASNNTALTKPQEQQSGATAATASASGGGAATTASMLPRGVVIDAAATLLPVVEVCSMPADIQLAVHRHYQGIERDLAAARKRYYASRSGNIAFESEARSGYTEEDRRVILKRLEKLGVSTTTTADAATEGTAAAAAAAAANEAANKDGGEDDKPLDVASAEAGATEMLSSSAHVRRAAAGGSNVPAGPALPALIESDSEDSDDGRPAAGGKGGSHGAGGQQQQGGSTSGYDKRDREQLLNTLARAIDKRLDPLCAHLVTTVDALKADGTIALLGLAAPTPASQQPLALTDGQPAAPAAAPGAAAAPQPPAINSDILSLAHGSGMDADEVMEVLRDEVEELMDAEATAGREATVLDSQISNLKRQLQELTEMMAATQSAMMANSASNARGRGAAGSGLAAARHNQQAKRGNAKDAAAAAAAAALAAQQQAENAMAAGASSVAAAGQIAAVKAALQLVMTDRRSLEDKKARLHARALEIRVALGERVPELEQQAAAAAAAAAGANSGNPNSRGSTSTGTGRGAVNPRGPAGAVGGSGFNAARGGAATGPAAGGARR